MFKHLTGLEPVEFVTLVTYLRDYLLFMSESVCKTVIDSTRNFLTFFIHRMTINSLERVI